MRGGGGGEEEEGEEESEKEAGKSFLQRVREFLRRGGAAKAEAEAESERVSLSIRFLDKMLEFEVERTQSVLEVKVLVSRHVAVKASSLHCFYGGKLIPDSDVIADLELVSGYELLFVSHVQGSDMVEFSSLLCEEGAPKDGAELWSSLSFMEGKTEEKDQQMRMTREVSRKRIEEVKRLSRIPSVNMLAIIMWTSNILYRELNGGFRQGEDMVQWRPFLTCFVRGLKSLQYHTGKVFRGIPGLSAAQFRVEEGAKRKRLLWKSVTACSKNRKKAEAFLRGRAGVLFEIHSISGRDISAFSVFPEEEEVVFMPYTRFEVVQVREGVSAAADGDAAGVGAGASCDVVVLREVMAPKGTKVVFWVDDQPGNNTKYIQAVERSGTSVVCCTSTEDAVEALKMYRWLLFLNDSDIRIVTDMVRYEPLYEPLTAPAPNYLAGVHFIQHVRSDLSLTHHVLIFCTNVRRCKETCDAHEAVDDRVTITAATQDLIRFLSFGNHWKDEEQEQRRGCYLC
eukprot:TRINITY_DN2780_c0_g1_i1.p1 TRINITY_DN2780_c0_g1~~TRINITY_DN2780_c0_g1_i1.p1  ORF type:complete len:511 (-),score=201.65 TRINITY_DN2780_c0_g1_i1:251-1783(-)